MKLWKTLAGLAVLALSVTRCDLGTPPQAVGGGGTEVEGILVDQHGHPAAGIWVRVYPDSGGLLAKGSATSEAFLAIRDSARTNANGEFSLPNLPSGTYNLIASLKRSDTTLALFRRSIAINGSVNLGTDTLRVAGSLLLNVAVQGSTVSGAQCYIPGSPYLTLSDLSGLCTLTGLPPGTYTVSVALSGLPSGHSSAIAVVSFQVTNAGTVNLTWVSLPPGILPPPDSEWSVIVDPIPTLFIGPASAAFKDSIAFTGLKEVRTFATWAAGGMAVGRNFQVGDGDFDPRGRTAQNLNVNLRFVNKDLVPSGGSGRVFDARGVLTHSDSAMPWNSLHHLTSKYRRAAIILIFPDSVSSATSLLRFGLKINRVVLKKNGATLLDSVRLAGFASLQPNAFLAEYLNPAAADSIEVLAYGTYSEYSELLYRGSVKLAPNMTQEPELQMSWVGPASRDLFLCLIATSQPPTLASPAQGAVNVATTTTLAWDSLCYALGYRLQIATDSTFTTLVVNDSNVIPAFRNVTLAAGKGYFWRVAGNTLGGVTGWSAVRRFTTGGATTLAAPTLVSPANDTANVGTSANFSWTAVTGATSYRVQITKDSTFASIYRVDTLTGLSRSMGPLDLSSRYYWRVIAVGSAGTAPSVTRRLTTQSFVDGGLLPAPLPLTPMDSTVNAPTIPTFTWSRVNAAAYYQIQVSTSLAFASVAFQDSLVTDTSKTGFTLLAGTAYYWRVRSKSSLSIAGGWSGIQRLTTLAGAPSSTPPSAPTFFLPKQDSIGVATSPSLNWSGATGATSYRVQVATDSAFTVLLVNDSVATTSKSIGPLATGTRYYWRVFSVNSTGGAASPTQRFTTVPNPAKPTLLAPSDNALNIAADSTSFSWSALPGATSYWLQVSTNTSFSATVFNGEIAGVTATITTLAQNTRYYWRVKALSDTQTYDYAARFQFTTVPGSALPAAPSLGTPKNDSLNVSTTPNLNWSSVVGASSYRVQVSTDTAFVSLAVNDSVTTTNKTVAPLSTGTQYYWRAGAVNINGITYSARRRFTTRL